MASYGALSCHQLDKEGRQEDTVKSTQDEVTCPRPYQAAGLPGATPLRGPLQLSRSTLGLPAGAAAWTSTLSGPPPRGSSYWPGSRKVHREDDPGNEGGQGRGAVPALGALDLGHTNSVT